MKSMMTLKMKMKSSTCLFCKRVISDHSRGETLDCALEIAEGLVVPSTKISETNKPTIARGFLID